MISILVLLNIEIVEIQIYFRGGGRIEFRKKHD